MLHIWSFAISEAPARGLVGCHAGDAVGSRGDDGDDDDDHGRGQGGGAAGHGGRAASAAPAGAAPAASAAHAAADRPRRHAAARGVPRLLPRR